MRRYRWLVALGLIGAALGAGFGGGYWYARSSASAERFPVIGKAPGYTLTNQLGRSVSSDSFAGKVQVVTFLFPYCTDYCPLIAAHLVSLEGALAAAGLAGRVRIVAFNVDPEHAGPAVMAAFMRQYGWDPSDLRWQFLTGTADEIRRVVTGGYHIDYQQVPEALARRQEAEAEAQGLYAPPPEVSNLLARKAGADYDVTHNDALVLVDPRGRIRRVYEDADRLSDATLTAAVGRLLAGG